MTIEYFLGRTPTGDSETGPDGGEEYDGYLWLVDTDCDRMGENGERIPVTPEPMILAHIESEQEADVVRGSLAEYHRALETVAVSRDAALVALLRLADAAEEMDNTNGTTRAPEAVREYLAALSAARELLAKTEEK
jgi:hypothetical protein